ncbi:phosphotransferase [Zobellia uliginosa]|uniref:phosphotransferase n=1 Tax=Zobellia uliginosa TaxID=143224 RepID=UPI001C07662C|nr:phosphotransferase [Zobellia uliginosa]MBU2948746.1 phosphotransferase [Zobellia uliginosa]
MTVIDANTPLEELQNYLLSKEWLDAAEKITAIEKPGEGNMNVVLRIITDQRSFILKQSRPYVQKYQQIKAPVDRIAVEKKFYQAVRDNAVHAHVPKIIGFDASENLLLLEDLGNCKDMTYIYQKHAISNGLLDRLIFILGLIHRKKAPSDFPENMEMRQLNHQHIFELPFLEDNGFQLDDIQPGLQELSLQFKTDKKVRKIVKKVGKKYLKPGNTLLHGDYYPGSWMTEAENLYIIDPEFGFVGFPEFDLGVMAAHVIIATGKKGYMKRIHAAYQGDADLELMSQMAGIEIMRRLIGLAQLPLDRTLKEKSKLLKKARKLILSP